MRKPPSGRVTNQSALVLVSGGLDSMACLRILHDQGFTVSGLHVSYGQAAALQERRAAISVAAKMKVLLHLARLSSEFKFGTGELVGRNLMLLSCALFLADPKPNAIVMGVHQGSPYFDCSPRFITSMREQITEHTNGKTTLVTPFLEWEKVDIYAYIKKARLPFDLTYSCEAGTKKTCGSCLSCLDRGAFLAD
jgi:7-cyano-7-deazaguanine synthase